MASLFQPMRTIQATQKHTATIFFFHGAGDTGPGIYEWLKNLTGDKFIFPHIKIIFPTAPKRPYSPFGGEPAHVWFDRRGIYPSAPEHKETLQEICDNVVTTIEKEMATNSVPNQRIILGGFSMGGALAMHVAYKCLPNVAGVFAMSSFLNDDTQVYEKIKSSNSKAPIFMCHGEHDDLVSYDWAETTFKNLKEAGVHGEFNKFVGGHELSKSNLYKLREWIEDLLPQQ